MRLQRLGRGGLNGFHVENHSRTCTSCFGGFSPFEALFHFCLASRTLRRSIAARFYVWFDELVRWASALRPAVLLAQLALSAALAVRVVVAARSTATERIRGISSLHLSCKAKVIRHFRRSPPTRSRGKRFAADRMAIFSIPTLGRLASLAGIPFGSASARDALLPRSSERDGRR